MDLATLAAAVMVAIGLLGTDAVLYSSSVQVEVASPPEIASIKVDRATLELEFTAKLNEIADTGSVVHPPDIRSSGAQGIGMALAEAANVKSVAFALQSALGYHPDRLRFALYVEDGKLRGVVNGSSHMTGEFHNVIIPAKDETLLAFVQRSALWGASQLAPYSTSLYLLQQHAADKDFTDVVALAQHAKSLLPATPRSFDRALFDNVLGLVALFKNDKQGARDSFDAAMLSDPTNPVPFLNAAFTDLEFDEYQYAANRMEQLIRLAPPANNVLLSTAYFTWGAALMGLKDLTAADRMLAEAARINPENSTALQLWSEEKALEGDKAAAARLAREALAQTATAENYAEVAALYFHLSWGDNEPVTRSQFSNPSIVSFH
jgi:tetratricopeptide (TPR) repeat protein